MNGPGSGSPSYCPDCGAGVDPGSNYCSGCGSAIYGGQPAAFCRTCGTEYFEGDEFCPNCGDPRPQGGDASGVDRSGRGSRTGAAPDRGGQGSPRGQGGPGAPGAGPGGPGSSPDQGGPRGPSPGPGGPGNPQDRGGPRGPPPGPGGPGRSSGDLSDRERFERQIDQYLRDGWDVEYDDGDHVVMVDRGYGHPAVHVLLFLVTSGIGNLLYAWYKHENDVDRVSFSVDDPTPAGPPPSFERENETSVWSWAGGLFLLLLGGIVSTGLDPVSLLFGLTFLTAGLLVFPPTKRRLDERSEVTDFGTVRSTEETVVSEPSTPCVVCSSPIETGVERSYKEQKVVAGIPIVTTDSGENYYCEDCATDSSTEPNSLDGTSATTDDDLAYGLDENSSGDDTEYGDWGEESTAPEATGTDEGDREFERN